MLTREDDIDVHALRRQGWTISAIARHLGRDRKTIRAYLNGRQAGVRAPAGPDPFDAFVDYCRARLAEDPHLWAMTLFDEVTALGYDRAYSTFTRQLRARGLRPACEPCSPAKGRPVAVIEHPAGEETQWDWVELRTRPRPGPRPATRARRSCWSVHWRTPGAGEGCSAPRWSSRNSSTPCTGSAPHWVG